jgi:hypothetical protein
MTSARRTRAPQFGVLAMAAALCYANLADAGKPVKYYATATLRDYLGYPDHSDDRHDLGDAILSDGDGPYESFTHEDLLILAHSKKRPRTAWFELRDSDTGNALTDVESGWFHLSCVVYASGWFEMSEGEVRDVSVEVYFHGFDEDSKCIYPPKYAILLTRFSEWPSPTVTRTSPLTWEVNVPADYPARLGCSENPRDPTYVDIGTCSVPFAWTYTLHEQ